MFRIIWGFAGVALILGVALWLVGKVAGLSRLEDAGGALAGLALLAELVSGVGFCVLQIFL